MWHGLIAAIESGVSGGLCWQCSAVFFVGFIFFCIWHYGGIPFQAIQDSAICESLKGHVGKPWGCRLDPLEACSVIYLIPQGERSYGRVISNGASADVPAISFLAYAEKILKMKHDFNSHLVLISGSLMFTKDMVLSDEM